MLLFHPAETVTGRLPLRTGLLSSVYALVAFAKWLGEIFYVRGRHPSSKGRPRELPRHFLILKANKRGISTPLISAVSPAAAPFQKSCALLISLFFCKLASVRTRTCSPCLYMPPYPASWFCLPTIIPQKDDASDGFEPFHCP